MPVPWLLSPRATMTEARVPQSLRSTREAAAVRSPRTTTADQRPRTTTREKSVQQ